MNDESTFSTISIYTDKSEYESEQEDKSNTEEIKKDIHVVHLGRAESSPVLKTTRQSMRTSPLFSKKLPDTPTSPVKRLSGIPDLEGCSVVDNKRTSTKLTNKETNEKVKHLLATTFPEYHHSPSNDKSLDEYSDEEFEEIPDVASPQKKELRAASPETKILEMKEECLDVISELSDSSELQKVNVAASPQRVNSPKLTITSPDGETEIVEAHFGTTEKYQSVSTQTDDTSSVINPFSLSIPKELPSFPKNTTIGDMFYKKAMEFKIQYQFFKRETKKDALHHFQVAAEEHHFAPAFFELGTMLMQDDLQEEGIRAFQQGAALGNL
eukprot:CAMPEP_0117427346 /NCGR_PEP_ID=MMETSP0758-20121206/7219_1 /TAXON_ID=63605 /ORGANISM="Percolomonas cosmopolitus, Strain AE-1 (ATCC 50343)" /LENGTH=325 /DNA_ID=CAMNT_0005212941 /DNA_START=1567 /DNA_END=2540 /DNA_ORIENTATION=+